MWLVRGPVNVSPSRYATHVLDDAVPSPLPAQCRCNSTSQDETTPFASKMLANLRELCRTLAPILFYPRKAPQKHCGWCDEDIALEQFTLFWLVFNPGGWRDTSSGDIPSAKGGWVITPVCLLNKLSPHLHCVLVVRHWTFLHGFLSRAQQSPHSVSVEVPVTQVIRTTKHLPRWRNPSGDQQAAGSSRHTRVWLHLPILQTCKLQETDVQG